MPRLALIALLTLAACGADGAPEPPTKSGITVSGEAQIGVVTVK
jgi:predicted small lipoprotein YifL